MVVQVARDDSKGGWHRGGREEREYLKFYTDSALRNASEDSLGASTRQNQGRWTVQKNRRWKSIRMGARNQAKTKEIPTKWKTTRWRLRRRPKGGGAEGAAHFGVLVVFHLVRISDVLA